MRMSTISEVIARFKEAIDFPELMRIVYVLRSNSTQNGHKNKDSSLRGATYLY